MLNNLTGDLTGIEAISNGAAGDAAFVDGAVAPSKEAIEALAWHFAQLAGEWRIDRRILHFAEHDIDQDRSRVEVEGRLQGRAHFERIDEHVFAYREQGVLRLRNGATVNAVRRYRYRLDGAALTIDFDDGPNAGSRFLRLEAERENEGGADGDKEGGLRARPDTWSAVDHHLCGKDLYQALHRFEGFAKRGEPADPARQRTAQSRRIVQWTSVNGPRKDYAIVTVLHAVSASDIVPRGSE